MRPTGSLLACLTLGLPTASADVIKVPDQYETIQAAVDVAVDGDVILVSPGVYTSAQEGHVVLVFEKTITIRSAKGPEATIIDGEDARRCIACIDCKDGTIEIDGFTLTNGNSTSFDYDSDGESSYWENDGGGVLLHNNDDVRIENCIITENHTESWGGGIFDYKNNHTAIIGCTIENNNGFVGAGVANYEGETFTIDSCLIRNNDAEYYGGIYSFYSPDSKVVNSTITHNTSLQSGGGIASDLITLENVIACENIPDQILGYWQNNGRVCLSNSCDDENQDGIPDVCQSDSSDGTLNVPLDFPNIQDAIDAASYGDTILVAPGTYSSTDSHVLNTGGKPLTIRATGSPQETILDGNAVMPVVVCTSGEGTTTVIQGFTIQNGLSNYGGGIRCVYSGPVFRDCVIRENIAEYAGGGIYFDNSNSTMTDCVVTLNKELGGGVGGGGIYCRGGSDVTLHSCLITDNEGYIGGGLSINRSSITATDSMFINNIATDDEYPDWSGGGGITGYEADLELNQCEISNNYTSGRGGGIDLAAQSSLTAMNCVISNNVSTDDGGGIHSIDSTMLLTSSTICGNAPDQIYGPWTDGGQNTVEYICPNDSGACCISTWVVCEISDEFDCLRFGGTWMGTGTTCEESACPSQCIGDANGDGNVGINDILLVIAQYGATCP